MPPTLGSHPTRAPRPARRLRLPLLLPALAVSLSAVAAAPVAAQSPEPSGFPAIPPGTCFLVEPGTSPAPRPSVGPSATPLPEREGTIPSAGGRLTPGETYQDWSLGPTISLVAGDCWAATPIEAGYGLALVWGGHPVPSVLSLAEFTGLVFEDPCLATSENTLPVPATPDGLITDISQSPYLIVSEPVEADLGGLPALRVEVATQSPMGCEPPATWLWASPGGGGFVLEDGEEATFLLAELNGRTLVASWETYMGGDFETFSAAAEALVSTLSIDPSTDTYDPNATPEPRPSAAPDASAAPVPLGSASPAPAPVA